MITSVDQEPKGSEARLLRGYGPLLAMIVSFLAMALLAPTVAPEARVPVASNRPGTGPGSGAGAATTLPGAGAPGGGATEPGALVGGAAG